MMKKFTTDFIYAALLLLLSICTVADLFINLGKPANGDGLIHTVVPAMFAHALSQGNFPVTWVSEFANYGLPLGTISQQVTTYFSALVTLITHNPPLGFNMVVFWGVLLSCLFFYIFLRLHFSPVAAFAGTFLFNLTPYRILNIYVRGALPEFFAGVFFPLLGIASYIIIVKRNIAGLFLFAISITLLTLTHPFMDIIGVILIGPYIIFLLFFTGQFSLQKIAKYAIAFCIASIVGIAMTAYYMLPLVFEIKYFYYGLSKNHLTPNNFLTLSNFFSYKYPYFSPLDIFNRGFYVNTGIIESCLMLGGLVVVCYQFIRHKLTKESGIIIYAVVTGIIFVFFLTPFSAFIYQHSNLLSNIQFPWRMLSGFIFLPPILFAFLITKVQAKFFTLICLFIIGLFAFPQMYGKNYTQYPYSYYSFTVYNLDAIVMNPIWTELSNNYPVTSKPYQIISGNGKVISAKLQETRHTYTIDAKNEIHFVDHTFYFPGWKAFIDTQTVPIEFQDPAYRGVITFLIPAGRHAVTIRYTDTKVRLLGKILSIVGVMLFILLLVFFYMTSLGKRMLLILQKELSKTQRKNSSL